MALSPNHLLLQHIHFALLNLQHVFEVMDFSVECALLFRHLLYLLALLIQSCLFFFQAQTQGIHLNRKRKTNCNCVQIWVYKALRLVHLLYLCL